VEPWIELLGLAALQAWVDAAAFAVVADVVPWACGTQVAELGNP
jgi:hypothetical protein